MTDANNTIIIMGSTSRISFKYCAAEFVDDNNNNNTYRIDYAVKKKSRIMQRKKRDEMN